MKFPYIVNLNGIVYPTGAEVPVGKQEKPSNINTTLADKIEENLSENVISNSNDLEKEKKTYTKTEINRMSSSELQELANAEGIPNALETSGSKLKSALIAHFGL